MFSNLIDANEYLSESSDMPATDIAGMMMFDSLIRLLPYIESSGQLTASKRKVVLRQIAKKARDIADRYNLNHSVDLDRLISGNEAA